MHDQIQKLKQLVQQQNQTNNLQTDEIQELKQMVQQQNQTINNLQTELVQLKAKENGSCVMIHFSKPKKRKNRIP